MINWYYHFRHEASVCDDRHRADRRRSSCHHQKSRTKFQCNLEKVRPIMTKSSIPVLLLVIWSFSFPPTTSAEFGDRIAPLSSSTSTSTTTPNPFRNYRKFSHLVTPFTVTTETISESVTFPTFDDASPDPESEEPESNGNSDSMSDYSNRTWTDEELYNTEEDEWSYPYNYLYDFDPMDLDSPWFYQENDTNSMNVSSSDIVNFNYNDSVLTDFEEGEDSDEYNMYPLEPPKLNEVYVNTSGNDNISSSDTYSRFRYAPAPYINPFDPTHQMKKVVFINPVDPKPGHHHTPLNVHKIYSGIGSHLPGARHGVRYIPGPPVYRDSGPRLKYVPKSLKHAHRLPSHYHIKKYPSGKLGPIHSHEYHHHPSKDVRYYGYIPGIPGKPWKDYPIYSHVPKTKFHCKMVKYPGFYADIDSGCQVWHYCQPDGRHDKFLCPNGTLFNQNTRVCDWWFNVHCPSSIYRYNINADLYKQYKKILHLHPGVKPHVHKVAIKPKYHLTGLGGSRVHGHHVMNKLGGSRWKKYPTSHHPYPNLSRKVHKHHAVKEKMGGGGHHSIPKKMHHMKNHHHPSHLNKPHHKTHHHHKMYHHRGHQPGHGSKHHYPHPLPEIPPHFHIPKHHHQPPHPEIPPHHQVPMSHHGMGGGGGGYVVKRGPHGILKVKKKMFIPHSHSIPLLDHAGRAPHHGHLILHHRIK